MCIPIEEVIHDPVGIKRLSSEAVDGSCELKVRVQQGYETKDLAVTIRAHMPTLSRLAEHVRDDLSALPGVRVVKLWSTVPYEIAIDVSAERLRQHQLTLADVADEVRHAYYSVEVQSFIQGVVSLSVRLNDETPFKGDALYRNLEQVFFRSCRAAIPPCGFPSAPPRRRQKSPSAFAPICSPWRSCWRCPPPGWGRC